MYSAYYLLEKCVSDCLHAGDHDGALTGVKDFVFSIMSSSSAPGEVNGSKKLDELCRIIGDDFAHVKGKHERISHIVPDDRSIVIVCTGIYRYGGTSLLIADLVKAHPGRECVVLSTDLLGDVKAADLEADRIGGTGSTLLRAPPGNCASKMNWLIDQLVERRPSRIFLLNHHQDSVIIAATQLFVKHSKVMFIHHADYNLCLGLHMIGVIHVDIHNVGYFNCRMKENINNNVYLPLVVSDHIKSPPRMDFGTGEFVTCSSGTAHKFLNFYLYPYSELIAQRLAHRSGTHLHIGSLPEFDLDHIRSNLTKLGVDPGRFVYVPWVKDLWSALLEYKVDLLIGSFPIGGARTTLEAMAAGIPIMMHQSYLSRFYSSRDLAYPNHFVWKYPHQFIKLIEIIDGDMLAVHSRRARGHYLTHYCYEAVDLPGEITRICDGTPIMEAPPLYSHDPDLLDRTLHYAHISHIEQMHAKSTTLANQGVTVPAAIKNPWYGGLGLKFGKLLGQKKS